MRRGSICKYTGYKRYLVPLRDLAIQISPELGGRSAAYFELSDNLAGNYCILVK